MRLTYRKNAVVALFAFLMVGTGPVQAQYPAIYPGARYGPTYPSSAARYNPNSAPYYPGYSSGGPRSFHARTWARRPRRLGYTRPSAAWGGYVPTYSVLSNR
jgi:hypothetical protein